MTPDYLKQDQNGTGPGVVSNMVKAIMDGHNKFKQQGGAGAATGDGNWFGPSSVGGAPLSGYDAKPAVGAPMVPPVPAPMASSPPQVSQGMAPSPFRAGASPMPFAPDQGQAPGMIASNNGLPGMPNGVDPTMNALFSEIPRGG